MSSGPEQDAPKAPLGGRLAWWPFAAAFSAVAAIVIVIVLVNALAGGGTTGSRQQGTGLLGSGAVACPRFFEDAGTHWVPAKPAGVGSKTKLVPTLHPTHVTICRYASTGAPAKSLRLAGEHTLSGRLDRVVDDLRRSKPATHTAHCTALRATPTDYLIGLRYAEAIVWVSAPGQPCLGTSNGAFVSDRNLATVAATSYAARTWVR